MLLKIQRELYRKEIKADEDRKRHRGTEIFNALDDYISLSSTKSFDYAKGDRKIGEIASTSPARLIITSKSIDVRSGFYEVIAELQYIHASSANELEPIRAELKKRGLERVADNQIKVYRDRD